jgi:putative inorganic carbon (HCO3(-)) transporter
MYLHTFGPAVMYIGAIVATLLSIIRNPRIGLYFLVPLLPMQTARYWIHGYPMGEKMVDVVLLGVLIGLLIHSEKPVFVASPLNKLILIFCVLTFLGLWEGSFLQNLPLPISYLDPRFSNWKNYVEMMLIFFVAAAALKTPKQMIIIFVLVCASVLMVNRSYHSTVGGRDYSQYSDQLREAGPLGYAGENGMGAFEAQMAVFLLGLSTFSRRKLVRMGLWTIALTSIYSLVFTFSRGGYLGLLVGLLVLGLIRERKLLLMLAVLLVVWESIVPHAVRDRVFMTYQEGQLDASAEERIAIWQDALDVITHNPVLGRGFDTYEFMGRVGLYRDTHNYYLKIILELGLVGLFFFLWMITSACRMSWQLFRTASDPTLRAVGCALFATVMCAAVVNLFGDRWSYLQVNGFLWVFMGMAARGLWLIRREGEQAEAGDLPAGIESSGMAEVVSV